MPRLLVRLAAALVALVVVAAGTPAAADPGADYSWYRPSAAQLSGTRVVVRYLVPASWRSGKALDGPEARWLLAQGKAVCLVWEWAPRAALDGYSAGLRDAQRAELARREVAAPPLPVYLAIDWDVRPWQVSPVLAYLAGAAAVLGRDRVGVYGSYRVVHAAGDAGYRWLWQTYAWSAGRWDPRARLRQTRNGALWAGQGDLDTATGDVGGWIVGPVEYRPGDLRPVHVPPPPAPRPLWYRVRRGDTLWAIARRTGTTWPTLARINRLRHPDRIYPGELLRLH